MKRIIPGIGITLVSAFGLWLNKQAYLRLARETPFGKPPQDGYHFVMGLLIALGLAGISLAIWGFFKFLDTPKNR